MPRKAKEKIEELNIKETHKKASSKKQTTAKKSTKSIEKKPTTKKATKSKAEVSTKVAPKSALKKVTEKVKAVAETITKQSASKNITKKAETENIKPTTKSSSTSTKKATKKTNTTVTAKSTTKKSSTAKTTTNKATTAKTVTSKTAKDKTATTKATTVKATSKKSPSKKSTSKKTTANTSKKSNTKKQSAKIIEPISTTTEYYDLPFRYNQTVVKILAQTPNMLFIYWDISDIDRKNFEDTYGANFFENTRPVLIISNQTMNYTFEVEINDFANSWYLHINDANCDYKVELGRRFKTDSNQNDTNNTRPYYMNEYLYITSSNTIEAPNDHILLDRLGKSIFFRNVKTSFIEERNISSLSYLQNFGRIYNIYDLYKQLYKDEFISDKFELNLPSSSSSPTFK